MAIEIKVPSVGESITEGSIARWIKKNGDLVRVDEPIFELETEKASTEVPAPASGKLTVKTPEGTKVSIGAVVGSIEPADVPAATAPAPAPSKEGNGPAAAPTTAPAAGSSLSPSAARLANEEGIDPARLAGTGKRGMVLKEDVQKAVEDSKTTRSTAITPPTPSPAPSVPLIPAGQRETRQRMSVIRQRIAQRLLQSQQTTASLTTFNECDMSAITDLRARYKDKFKEKSGVNLGFMSFFVKAVIEALKAYPVVNGRIDENDIVYQNFWNIGVAVSTEKGLMVPVLHDADQLGFADIEKGIAAASGPGPRWERSRRRT